MANNRRTVLLGCMVSGFTVVICLLLMEIVLRMLPVDSDLLGLAVNAANPVFHFQPNREYTHSSGWNFKGVNRGRTNNVGWISDQTYDSSSHAPLLAIVGDSYVEAVMVPYKETIQARLAASVGSRGRVYGFGVSGAPLSQYLVEAEYAARTFHPVGITIVIVGNDFDESLVRFKIAPGQHGFADSAGTLVLRRSDYAPGRLRSLIWISALARYLFFNLHVAELAARRHGSTVTFVGNTSSSVDSERVALSKRAVNAFLDQAPARAGLPPARILLVVDGIRTAIYSAEGARVASGSYYQIMREYFIEAANKRGFEVLDMQPRFTARYAREHQRFEYPFDAHWNGLGHEEAALGVEGSALFHSIFPMEAPAR